MTSHGQRLLGELIRATIRCGRIEENYRPSWLNGLELDFWVPEWNLAFEFQGDQHFTPVYGVQNMTGQQARDKLKRKLCEQLGIMLVTFEAATLEPFRMKSKLFYHIARINPDMKKGERKKLLARIMIPKWQSKQDRKRIQQAKYSYCRRLKESFESPTAYKRGSKLRKEAFRAKFYNVDWRDVYESRKRAMQYYNPPAAPMPKYGAGMARAAITNGP